MSSPIYSIYLHENSGRQLLHINPPDDYMWLIHFIEMCSFVDRCDYVISGLEQAISFNQTNWQCAINDITLRYDLEAGTVSAIFVCDDTPIPSKMKASDFLYILRDWRDRLFQ